MRPLGVVERAGKNSGTFPAPVVAVRREVATATGRAVGPRVGGVSVGCGEAGWRRPGGGWPSMRGTAWRTPGWTVGRMQTGAADGEGAALTRMQAVPDGTRLAFHLPLAGR